MKELSITPYERLLAHGVKPSLQRIAIMEYLMQNSTHPSVDEIYTALSATMPTLSKTTVYNTLRLLAEQGAAQMLTIDERNANFDGDISGHAHFYCKSCGKIYDIPQSKCLNKSAKENLEGFTIDETHLYYRGVCKNCLK